MTAALDLLHWVAGLIVLAEALNKLERVDLLSPQATAHDRWVDGLKAFAWGLLALGGAGAVFAPMLLGLSGASGSAASRLAGMQGFTFAETCVLSGFAILIIRTRVKEG